MIKRFFCFLFAIIILPVSSSAYAGHGAKEEAPAAPTEPEIGYYTFSPDITTNVATLNPRDKIHYVRLKLALMLEDSNDAAIIADVEPLLKDAVIDILGAKKYINDNPENFLNDLKAIHEEALLKEALLQ